jgi:hypothetical protein
MGGRGTGIRCSRVHLWGRCRSKTNVRILRELRPSSQVSGGLVLVTEFALSLRMALAVVFPFDEDAKLFHFH